MNIRLQNNTKWFWQQSDNGLGSEANTMSASMNASTIQQTEPNSFFDVKLWGWSLTSIVPWAINARGKIQAPSTINKGLKRRTQPRGIAESDSELTTRLRFRPYVSKVPWHGGVRGFLSQLFPRYGHYCGPNWSSGKDGGSLVWDKRPIDWLDFCCYCHDIGYDSHDQASLLKADLAFLECLERPKMATKGDAHVALLYKTMCITGMEIWNMFDVVWAAEVVVLFGSDRSEKYTHTIPKEPCESTIRAIFNGFWMAQQYELEKLEPEEGCKPVDR